MEGGREREGIHRAERRLSATYLRRNAQKTVCASSCALYDTWVTHVVRMEERAAFARDFDLRGLFDGIGCVTLAENSQQCYFDEAVIRPI